MIEATTRLTRASKHVGFSGLWATALTLHGDQRSKDIGRQRFVGRFGLGKPFLRQFRITPIGGDTRINDGSNFVVGGGIEFQHPVN
jgi:hypothetical protein